RPTASAAAGSRCGRRRRGRWRGFVDRLRRRETRPNARATARAPVIPLRIAVLRRAVHDVRIALVVAREEAVAADRHVPVTRPNAERVAGPRGTALREVVLRAAADRVERQLVAG